MRIESFDEFKSAQAKDCSLQIKTQLTQGSQGCSHTQSLNPTKRFTIFLAQLTNIIGESFTNKFLLINSIANMLAL